MAERASSQELTRLKALLDGALAGLDSVVPKRLFGCDGWFARGNIFALVWKDGRVGLRLSEAELLTEALSLEGAGPWLQGGKPVRHWALLPKTWAAEPAKLRAWGRRAHALALARPERSAVSGKAAAKTVKPAVFRTLGKDGRDRRP